MDSTALSAAVVARSTPLETGDVPAGAIDESCSLSTLLLKARAVVRSVGSRKAPLTALERRLLELGFVHGEHVEVLAAAPGGDPFVVRVVDRKSVV